MAGYKKWGRRRTTCLISQAKAIRSTWLGVTRDEYQNRRIAESIKQRVGQVEGKTIAILGLTYKPNTDTVEESDAIRIANALLREGTKLRVYDPAGMENAR